MEIKDYLQIEVEALQRGVNRVLDGITQQEITWRPSSGCNSMGIILLHMARFQDTIINKRLQGKPEIWESEKWFQKMGLGKDEAGAHMTVDQVNAFPVPQLKDLKAYIDAALASTLKYVKTLKPENLDRTIADPRMGDRPAAFLVSMVVWHVSQHIGELSYLRGLQRGMDK